MGLPYANRVTSITTLQLTYTDDHDLVVADLVVDAESFIDAYPQRTKRTALGEDRTRW